MNNQITQHTEAGALDRHRAYRFHSDEAHVTELKSGQIENLWLAIRNLAIVAILIAIGPFAPRLINMLPPFAYQHVIVIALYILALAIPLAQLGYAIARTATLRMIVTTERIDIYEGVFNRSRNSVELFRIRDFAVRQPIIQRLFRRGTLSLWTTDTSGPKVVLRAIRKPNDVMETVRVLAARNRELHGVRVVE